MSPSPKEAMRDRVREVLIDVETREQVMFGGVAFMIDDRMLVAVMGDGALLARIDPDRSDELLARPGAGPMEMGTRTMGRSWIRVDPEAITEPEDLERWIADARSFADQT